GVVHGDQPAHRNAGERIEQWEHGLEYRAADILEIDVDALRTGCSKTGGEIGCPVVDAGIEAEFLVHIPAFVWSARNANGAGPLDPSDLAHRSSGRACRGRGKAGNTHGRRWD